MYNNGKKGGKIGGKNTLRNREISNSGREKR
jgi:hypothetical protein